MQPVRRVACIRLSCSAQQHACADLQRHSALVAGAVTQFNAVDDGLLKQLPDYMRAEFPYHVTAKGIVHNSLMDQLSRNVLGQQSFQDFSRGYWEVTKNGYAAAAAAR